MPAYSPKSKLIKCSTQKARIRRSQDLITQDERGRKKVEKLQEKFRKAEEKKKKTMGRGV